MYMYISIKMNKNDLSAFLMCVNNLTIPNLNFSVASHVFNETQSE